MAAATALLSGCIGPHWSRETEWPGSGLGVIELRRDHSGTEPHAIGNVIVPLRIEPRSFHYEIRSPDGTLHIVRSDTPFKVGACVKFSGHADGPSRTHWSYGRVTLELSTACREAHST